MTRDVLEKIERLSLLARKSFLQRVRPTPPGKQRRLFVAGMQRSGTNMLMDVLEESYETVVFHERDARAFDNYQMRDVPAIRSLIDRSVAPVFVIKALCELGRLSDLMEEFSPARTLWIVRHYNDVVNSMVRSFGNMAKQVHHILDNPDTSEWLAGGMSEHTRNRVEELRHEGLDDVNGAAIQWYFRNILFFEQDFDKNPQVKLISYERLVTDPKAEFESIYDFVGLNFSPRVVRKVSPRSIGKNPPPILEEPIRSLCEGLFERFGEVLKSAE